MIFSDNYELLDSYFMASTNFLLPELAIVPKLLIRSSLDIPIPVSVIMIYFISGSNYIDIYKVSPGFTSLPDSCINLYFSSASLELLSNSLIKTSLSVYKEWATISKSLLVSALNSIY